MKFSLRLLLLLPLCVAILCVLAMIPLRMMREAQEQALAARRAAELGVIRAIEAAEHAELARRDALSVPATADEPPRAPVSTLKLVTWNIESEGNDPATIAAQLVELGRYDLFALQEVRSDNFERYATALNDAFSGSYRYFTSSSGFKDRLMMIYDAQRLQLVETRELYEQDGYSLNDGRYRSPLVGHLRDKSNDAEFLCMTVHLARGDAEYRVMQASGLRHWATEQALPVIALGDFNMDYEFSTERGNAALDAFLSDGVWRWVRPEALIDTNWYDGDGDGADDFPGSMLDFVFTAKTEWAVTSRVIVREGDFPDDEKTSDHRPVAVTVGNELSSSN